MRPHGTRARYIHGPDETDQPNAGCRCHACTVANTRAQTAYRLSVLRGRNNAMVDARQARGHALTLRAAGMSLAAMERLSGVDREQIRTLLDGHPTAGRPPATRILAVNARALLAVTPGERPDEGVIPGVGTQRRLRGLARAGWPTPDMAHQLGLKPQNTRRLLWAGAARCVTVETAQAVVEGTRRIWAVDPVTAGCDRTQVVRARNRAACQGWLPLASWDDDLIELPDDLLRAELDAAASQLPVDELRACANARYRHGDMSPSIVAAGREYRRRQDRGEVAS